MKISRYAYYIIILLHLSVLSSCEDTGTMTTINVDEGVDKPFSKKSTSVYNENELHTVLVNEVLPTQKYIYLNVSEGDKNYWVATLKQEVIVGKRYIFKGGLLKTNYESKEYNRMFEEIYLVKNMVPAHGNAMEAEVLSPNAKPEKSKIEPSKNNVKEKIEIVREGSIRIADLIHDPNKYEGKTIQLSGVCAKVNPNIMERNWIHLKDGSQDDYDLVITTDIFIPEGTEVTMTGVVALNKDFGAGYKYEIIVENGKIIK